MSRANIAKWSVQSSVDAAGVSVGSQKIQTEVGKLQTNLRSKFSAISSNFDSAFSQLKGGNISGFLGGIQGGIVGAGLTSLIGTVRGVADAFAEWIGKGYAAIAMQNRLSRELGVSREGGAALLAIGGAAGQDPQELLRASTQALRHIGQLRMEISSGRGGGAAGSWLRVLGIDAEQFARMGDFNEQLGLVGDRLRSLENAGERAAAGHAIFGESWNTLQPQLRLGSEGLQRIESYARQLGVTVSGETADSISATGRAMNEFNIASQLAADGLRNTYVAAMHEAMTGTRDYTVATQQLIEAQQQLSPVAREIGAAHGTLATTLQNMIINQIGPLAKFFNFVTGTEPNAPAPVATGVDWTDEMDAMAAMNDEMFAANALWRTRSVAIDQVTASLEREINAQGLSAEEMKRREFASQGATDPELRRLDELIARRRQMQLDERSTANLLRLQDLATTPFDRVQARLNEIRLQGPMLSPRQRGAALMNVLGAVGGESPLLGSLSANTSEAAAILQGAMTPQVDTLASIEAGIQSLVSQAAETHRLWDTVGGRIDALATQIDAMAGQLGGE